MPIYKYTAKNLESIVTRGKQKAENQEELAEFLRGSGNFLTHCSEITPKESGNYRPKENELAEFCSELGTMLSSGITLMRALDLLLQSRMVPRLKTLYTKVYDALQNGESFSEALAAQDGAFPPLLVSIFRSGEASGKMDQAAKKAALHYEKDHKIRSKLKNALVYPIILGVVALTVMVGVFIFILPNFFAAFADMGSDIPAITKGLMAFSRLLTEHWFACLMGVILLMLGVSTLTKRPAVRLCLDKSKLRLPKIGGLLQIIYTARFSRTLSTLYSSGLSILQALSVSAETIGNEYLAKQFEGVITQIRSGAPLSQTLRNVDGFVPKLAAVVHIGEESGRLDEMLTNMADSFDFESEKAIDRLLSMLEPALIVLLAIGVGVIMISVMLPLYTMYQTIG